MKMELGLNDKVVLVTGGGQGVGRRLCIDFAAEGAKVVVNDLVEERCAAVAEEITAAGGRAIAVAADVIDGAAVDAMFSRAEAELGSVDVLVNNAGVIPERREK